MDLESMKRWQWAALGLVAGLLLGFAYRYLFHEIDPGYPTIKGAELVAPLMVARDFETDRPIVDDVTVYPQLTPGDRVQLVTFNMRQVYRFSDPAHGGAQFTQTRWEPRQIWTEIPFDKRGPKGNTFGDRVASLQQAGALGGANLSFAWWQKPLPGLLLYAAAGVLLLGGVWPSLLNVLLGAGYGRDRSKDAYDLERFGGGDDLPGKMIAGRRGMTGDEAAQLAAVTSGLEGSTGGLDAENVPPPGNRNPDKAGFSPIRPLPQENVPEPREPEAPKEQTEYDGAWYPRRQAQEAPRRVSRSHSDQPRHDVA